MKKVKFSGWWQLALVTFIATSATMFSSLVMIASPIMYSSGQVAMTTTVYGLAFTVLCLMQGPPQLILAVVSNKIGARKPMMFGSVVMILVGLVLSRFINSGLTFVLVFGVGLGAISMICNQLTAQCLINNWFYQKRGRAQALTRGIAMAGAVVGPYIANYAIQVTNDFRVCWYIGGVLGIACLITSFFLKESPEEYGQLPDGIPEGQIIEESGKKIAVSTVYKRPIDESITVNNAVKTLFFWLAIIASSIGFLSMAFTSATSVHFLNHGVTISTLSSASGATAIVGIILMLSMSKVADRIEPAFIFGFGFAIFSISCISVFINPASTFIVYFYYAAFNLLFACGFGIMPTILANYFGTKIFPSIQGIALLFAGLVSSVAGIITGFIAQITGDYKVAFCIWSVLNIIAAIIMIFGLAIPCLKKYKKEIVVPEK